MFRFCDGFDAYGATADLAGKWDFIGAGVSWAAGEGVNGGGCAKFKAAAGPQFRKQFKDNGTTAAKVYYQLWTKISAPPASNLDFLRHYKSAKAHGLYISTSGNLFYSIANTFGGVGSTTNICDGTYHHIEVKLTEHISNGQLEVWIDGVLEITSSSATINGTVNYGAGALEFYSLGNTIDIWIDDSLIWDDTGASFTASPIGPRIIETLRPNATGDLSQFSRLSGDNNFAMVSEVAPDGDATYVHANAAGKADLYQFGNLSSTPTAIAGVVVSNLVRMEGGATMGLKAKAKSGTAVADGQAIDVTGPAWRTVQQVFETDPNTAAPWTGAGVDAAQFGMDLA